MDISNYLGSTKYLLLIVVLSISNVWANPSRSKQESYSCPDDTCTAQFVEAKLGNIFVIEATINGEKGTFLFDTGTSYLTLTSEFSEKISFNDSVDELSRYTQIKEKTGTAFRKVSVVQVGNAQFSNVQVSIRELDQISKVIKVKLDGLLGGAILNRTAFKVDFLNNTLTFINNASSLEGDWYDIFIQNSRFRIPTRLHEEWILLVLDTGATYSKLNSELFEGIEEEEIKTKQIYAEAVSNESKVVIQRYKNISSVYLGGNATLNDVRFNQSNKNILGANILRLGTFTVDPVSKQWQFTVRE